MEKQFFHFNKKNFALSFPLLKHDLNKRGFILKGTRRWPVKKLVNLIHGYLYLISLGIVVSYRKLRGFQEREVNVSVLLEKTNITYPSWNSNMESLEPSCRFSPKT